MSSFCYDAADKMAEFKAIVTASFDDIGSNVALANIPDGGPPLRPNRLVTSAAPPLSAATDKCTRRNPFSFLRKVKSHAASLLSSYTKLNPAPPHSFVPSLPPRAPTPVPFASSLPRNVLASASGKHLHPADVLESEPKSSFFDDDDDDDDDEYNVDRPVCPPPRRRRLSSALARSNSRLSSAIAAAPVFLGLSSHSVSTPYLVAEKNDVVRPELRPELAHVCSFQLSCIRVILTSFFFDLPAVIQIVSEAQASYKVLPPKVDIISLPSLFLVDRPFPSHAIVLFSPLLHCCFPRL
jgi:hypothetical protein